jgi:serine/threonine protein kinase
MNAEVWQGAKAVLAEIIDVSPDERPAYLAEHCANPQMRREVETLLRHWDDAFLRSRATLPINTSEEFQKVEFLAETLTSPAALETDASRVAVEQRCPPGRFALGPIANGRYVLLRLLGHGGQKDVFLARDVRLERVVVVSFVRKDLLTDSAAERFLREARATAQLEDHPNVVAVYDVGDENGAPYFVSQYVAGGSLAEVLAREPNRRLEPHRAIEIAYGIAQALDHAHRHDIIHRDVKPSNIWLSRDGIAKLGDFGIAATSGQADSLTGGTPLYASPEQKSGLKTGPQSDMYSLGVVLYEMMTGRPPFRAKTVGGVVSQHLNDTPPPPSSFVGDPARVYDDLILRLLRKKPAERPESMRRLLDELQDHLGGRVLADVERRRSPGRIASGLFVGSERELGELRQASASTINDKDGVFLLTGEVRSGKTSTVRRIFEYIPPTDTEVHVVSCHEAAGPPPFRPWIQIVRNMIDAARFDRILTALGPDSDVVGEISGDVQRQLPRLMLPPPLEPGQARFRLFDAFGRMFKPGHRLPGGPISRRQSLG